MMLCALWIKSWLGSGHLFFFFFVWACIDISIFEIGIIKAVDRLIQ